MEDKWICEILGQFAERGEISTDTIINPDNIKKALKRGGKKQASKVAKIG